MSESYSDMVIGENIVIDGQEYSLVGIADDVLQFGFPSDGGFMRNRCAYCGSMTDVRYNCEQCGAPNAYLV